MTAQCNPYEGMVVTLRRLARSEWQLTSECDGEVVSSVVMYADEQEALSRATTLAGWFDAELKVIHIGTKETGNAVV